MSLESEFKNAQNLIKRNQKFLILPSAPPDGDSIGSALALFFVLKKLGKEVTVVCHDPIPDIYQFLHPKDIIKENADINQDFIVTLDCSNASVDHIRYQVEHNKVNIVITPKKGNFNSKDVTFHYGNIKYDVIITVDTGDLEQLGPNYSNNPDIFYTVPVINIDHHASNSYFGKINLVDITSSSTTEILYNYFSLDEDSRGLIDERTATALLAGIITDTGSFQNANTTPKSLEVAADLVNLGAHQQEIIKNVYKTKQVSTLKLWGRILSNLKVDKKHKIIWVTVTNKDFAETKSHPDEVGGIIDDLLTNDPDTEIVLILKEKKQGLISGSLRTTIPTLDASQIAEIFGGGGHPRAAGFRIQSSDIAESERTIINKIRAIQSQKLYGKEYQESEPKQPALKPPLAELSLPHQKLPSLKKDKHIESHDQKSQIHEGHVKELTKKFFAKENGQKLDKKEIYIEDTLSTKKPQGKDIDQALSEGLHQKKEKESIHDGEKPPPTYRFGS